MGKQQETETAEAPHDRLVNYYSDKHYGGKHKEKIKEKLLSDKILFDHALQEIHQDNYSDIPYDQFKSKYEAVNGNPFPEKKNPSAKESSTGSSTGISKEDIDFVNQPLPENGGGVLASESTGQSFQKTDPTYRNINQVANIQFQSEEKKRPELEKKQKEEREAYLKSVDNGVSRPVSTIANVNQAFYGLPADLLEGFAVLTKNTVGRGMEAAGLEGETPTEQYPTYRWGQKYRQWIQELSPDNPAYQDELQAKVGTAIGDLAGLVFSGGFKGEAKLLSVLSSEINQYNKAGNLFATAMGEGKKLITSPPSLIGSLQSGLSEYNAAKASGADEDTAFGRFLLNATAGGVLEGIPVAQFFKRLDETTGGGVKNVLKNGAVQGVEEMTTEIAQQVFSNVDAANTYDATRKWYEGLTESGGIGFGLGFVLGAMGTSLRKKQAEAQTPQEKEEIQQAIDFVNEKANALAEGQAKVDESIDQKINTQPQDETKPVETAETTNEKGERILAQKDHLGNWVAGQAPEKTIPQQQEPISSGAAQVVNQGESPITPPTTPVQEVTKLSTPNKEVTVAKTEAKPVDQEKIKKIENKNSLITRIGEYNQSAFTKEGKAKKETKEIAQARTEIINEAKNQGYTVKSENGRLTLFDESGKKVNKTPIKQDKATFRSLDERSPEVKDFYTKLDSEGHLAATGDVTSGKFDIGLSEKDFQKAKLDIQNGVKSAPAEKLLNFVENVHKTGKVPYSIGAGALNQKVDIPLDEVLGSNVTRDEAINYLNSNPEANRLEETIMDYIDNDGNTDWDRLREDIEKDPEMFTNFVHDLSQDEFDTLKELVYGQSSEQRAFRGENQEGASSSTIDQNRQIGQQAQEEGAVRERTGEERAISEQFRDTSKSTEETLKEIDDIDLTHVKGLNMGSNQAKGTYLSTEKQNRYASRGGQLHDAKVSISNPLRLKSVNDLFDIRQGLLEKHFPEAEGSIDNLSDSQIQELGELVTKDLQDQGYDSIYFPESENQEGELIVFDRDKVKLTEHATQNRIIEQNDQLQREGAGGQLQGEGVNRNIPSSEQASSNQAGSSNRLQQGGQVQENVQSEGPQEEVGPEKKERSFPKQLTKDVELEEEIKKGISEEGRYYHPKSNKETNAQANDIIKELGLEKATEALIDEYNEIPFPVRVALGENIIKQANKQTKDATTEAEKKKYVNIALKAADYTSVFLTKLGQGVQAASLYARLSPEGVLTFVQREIRKVRNEKLADAEPTIEKIKDVVNNLNEEVINEILELPKVKELIDSKSSKVQGKLKKQAVKKAIDKLEALKQKIKQSQKGNINNIFQVIGENVALGAINVAQKALQAGLTVSQAINKAVAYINKEREKAKQEQLSKEQMETFSSEVREELKSVEAVLDPKKALKEAIKDTGTSIKDIIKTHKTNIEGTKQSLVDKLVKEAGLDEADAKELAKEISDTFDKMATKAKQQALKKLETVKDKINPKKTKEIQDKIIEQSNLGVLTDEKLKDIFAEKMGLPKLTEADAKELVALAEKVQSLPENSGRWRDAVEKLLAKQANIKGISVSDKLMAIWYSYTLSGPTTQLRNIYSNTTYLLGEVFKEMVYAGLKKDKHRVKMTFIGLYQGLGRGLLEAQSVLKTGVQAEKVGKIDAPMLLERHTFTKGKLQNWNPWNYAKYVGRFMSAADILFFHAAKEMRAYQVALMEAKNQNKNLPDDQLRDKVYEKLYNTSVARKAAELQAQQEGLKGNEFKTRVLEIMDQNRDVKITDISKQYGLKSTFNQDPEGTWGILTNLMSNAANSYLPIKLIVPFTKILGNVVNNYAEWSPYGLVRWAKGGIGWGKSHTKYDAEERTKVLISSLAGTFAMFAILGLVHDDEDEDSDFEITADLTGDYKKNYEINKPKYSIRIGKVWYNYQDTPLAIPLALAGYIKDAEKYHSQKELEDRMAIAAFGTIKYATDLSFMKGLSEFLDAFAKSGKEGADSFFREMKKQAVSTTKNIVIPNLYTQSKRTFDEIVGNPMKQADGMLEQIYRDIPVFNQNLNDMVNSLGEPVYPEMTNRFLPFQAKAQEDHAVYDLLNDKNTFIMRISKPQLEYGLGYSVTDEQYYQFSKRRGELIREKIEKNIKSLSTKSNDKVKDKINDYKEIATKKAKKEMFGKIKK